MAPGCYRTLPHPTPAPSKWRMTTRRHSVRHAKGPRSYLGAPQLVGGGGGLLCRTLHSKHSAHGAKHRPLEHYSTHDAHRTRHTARGARHHADLSPLVGGRGTPPNQGPNPGHHSSYQGAPQSREQAAPHHPSPNPGPHTNNQLLGCPAVWGRGRPTPPLTKPRLPDEQAAIGVPTKGGGAGPSLNPAFRAWR